MSNLTYSKIDFIRRTLPFIKVLRDNKYVKDINVFKIDKEYECKFEFSPFADDSKIELTFFIDDETLKDTILMHSPYHFSQNSTKLIHDYCFVYSMPKIINIDDFYYFFNNAHNWVIDVIIKQSEGSKYNEQLISKYIPESFMKEKDLKEYIKTRSVLNKFNL